MALIVSAATGNFNAGATWVGGVVPTIGDEAQAANGHTVTITANATCDLISNTGTGIFTLNDGVTLTANVTNKSTTTSRSCLQFTAASPAVGFIVGNCTGGTVASAQGANNTGSGTLNISGNATAGSGGSSVGISNSGTGTTNITGNATGGSGSHASGAYITTGTMSITGNVTGGSVSTSSGVRLEGAGTLTVTGSATGGSGGSGVSHYFATGILNIIGNVTGSTGVSSFGAHNENAGTLTITGIATGGTTNGAAGARNLSTGTINLTRAKGNAYGPGNPSGLSGVGALNAGLGVIEIQELEYGTFGQSPTSGSGIRLKKAGSNVAVFNYCDTAGAKTLIDATQNAAMPAANNVRSGVSYASGALTGSCAVPDAGSVALGVPVDNTTGTAVLTPAAVWGHATRTLTAGAGITASDVWSHATRTLTTSSGPTAVEIRQEMDSNSTKLANLDTTVSSRLAPSGTLATVTTLTNAPTVPSASAIATAVWAAADKTGYSLTSAERTAIATAVEASLINENDGQAIVNAIVNAIGNTNLSQVALVAAIRSDLATELGRIDAAISSRAVPGDIPTETEIAAEVWAKPTTELTITGSIGERAKNQSTVSTTGAQLAAALS